MREQLTQYVNLLFAGSHGTEDMQQEILQNTLDRYDDLIAQGKAPEAAYRLAIGGIGDINEILGSTPAQHSPAHTPPQSDSQDEKALAKKKRMHAIAIAMYICCVIPVLLLGNVGDGIPGVCLMFLIIAAATVLMIMAGSHEKKAEEENDEEPKTELGKAIKSAWGLVTLVIYLGISFWSGAWYITWLIFPIMAAVQKLIQAILDLKGAK